MFIEYIIIAIITVVFVIYKIRSRPPKLLDFYYVDDKYIGIKKISQIAEDAYEVVLENNVVVQISKKEFSKTVIEKKKPTMLCHEEIYLLTHDELSEFEQKVNNEKSKNN